MTTRLVVAHLGTGLAGSPSYAAHNQVPFSGTQMVEGSSIWG